MKNKVITTVLVPLNVKNLNGRIYDKKAAEKIINDFNKKKEIGVYGELGHPSSEHFNVILNNVSHIVESVELKDDCIIGNIQILNTEKGRILLKDIDKYVFRPRSNGNIAENGVVTISKFLTFDAILKETDAFGDE